MQQQEKQQKELVEDQSLLLLKE